jgi:hypothetical protein
MLINEEREEKKRKPFLVEGTKSSLAPMHGETAKSPLGRNDPLSKLTRRILYAVVLSRSPPRA